MLSIKRNADWASQCSANSRVPDTRLSMAVDSCSALAKSAWLTGLEAESWHIEFRTASVLQRTRQRARLQPGSIHFSSAPPTDKTMRLTSDRDILFGAMAMKTARCLRMAADYCLRARLKAAVRQRQIRVNENFHGMGSGASHGLKFGLCVFIQASICAQCLIS